MGERPLAAVLLGAVLALGGCADQQRAREQELADLLAWLPGTWDDAAQVHADAAAGTRPPHDPLRLLILPIDAPRMGTHAFFLQESAPDDPRRVMRAMVLTFAIEDHALLEHLYLPVEPRRWRNGPGDPDLFRSLQPDDLRLIAGCELKWRREASRLIGHADAAKCHGGVPGAEGAARSELTAELAADEFALGEQHFDAAGRLLQGRSDAALYRFRRLAP